MIQRDRQLKKGSTAAMVVTTADRTKPMLPNTPRSAKPRTTVAESEEPPSDEKGSDRPKRDSVPGVEAAPAPRGAETPTTPPPTVAARGSTRPSAPPPARSDPPAASSSGSIRAAAPSFGGKRLSRLARDPSSALVETLLQRLPQTALESVEMNPVIVHRSGLSIVDALAEADGRTTHEPTKEAIPQ